MLQDAGITPGEQVQTGGHNQTVLAVYNGEVDFGTTFYSVPLTPEGAPVFSYDDFVAGTVTEDMYEVPAEVIPNCAPMPKARNSSATAGACTRCPRQHPRGSAGRMQKVRIWQSPRHRQRHPCHFGPRFPADVRAQIEEALVAFAATEAWGTSIGSAQFLRLVWYCARHRRGNMTSSAPMVATATGYKLQI